MQSTETTIDDFLEIQSSKGRAGYGKLMLDLVNVIQDRYTKSEPHHGKLGYLERVYRPLFRYSQQNPKKLLKENFPDLDALKTILSIEGEKIHSDIFLIYVCTALQIESLQAHNANENLLSLELLLNSYYWCGFQNCIDKHDSVMAETLIKENNSKKGLENALVRHRRNREIRDEACNLARSLGPWKNYPQAAEVIYKELRTQLDNELGSKEPEGLLIDWFKKMSDRKDVFEMARTPPSHKKKK